MEKREFFESVLNHFLVISKFEENGVSSISDYKLKKDSFDLEFRSSNSKIVLDNLNPISSPLILGFKDGGNKMDILPPTEKWNSLTLAIGDNLTSIYSSLRELVKTEIPVITFNDLKIAIKTNRMSVPVYFAKVNNSNNNSTQLSSLRNIVLKKLTVFDKRKFYDNIVSNFIIVNNVSDKWNLMSLSLDENYKPVMNKSEMKYLQKFNSLEIITGFDSKITEVFVSPPTNEWKSLTIERTGKKSSIYQGIPALIGLGIPVIYLNDLFNSIKNNSYKIPVKFCNLQNYSGMNQVSELKTFMAEKFNVEVSKYAERRDSARSLELESSDSINSFGGAINSNDSYRKSTISKKKKPFWQFWK